MAALKAVRWKSRLGEMPDDGCVFEQFIFALQARPTATGAPPGSGLISKRVMRREYSDSGISIGVKGGLLKFVAVPVAPSWPWPPP
jgi:hypothetical protein